MRHAAACLLAALLVFVACQERTAPPFVAAAGAPATPAAPSAPGAPPAALPAALPAGAPAPAPPPPAGPAEPAAAAPAGHVPPIDCPLRRAGVDPSALHPFAEAEAYIAFLERADRAGWQRPEAVVAALGLSGRELVADYGAGSGYFTFRLARALPAGRVRAIDVQPEMVRHVHHRALSEGVANVEARLATADDVQLSGDEDLVFVCDVLHHVPDRAGLLRTLFAAMKPDARLVLLEFREGELPQGPPESVKIPRAALLSLATDAGFALAVEHADLVPYQHVLEFRRP